jgi:hypothetical protein
MQTISDVKPEIIERINRLSNEYKFSMKEIALMFGVADRTLIRIVENQPIQKRVIRCIEQHLPRVDAVLEQRVDAYVGAKKITVEMALDVLTAHGYEIIIRKRESS